MNEALSPRCFIFAALKVETLPIRPEKGDFIIAADKGFERLKSLGLSPDLLLGDFDSLGYEPDFENTVRLNVRKNDTDVSKALKLGLERGFRDFIVYGAVGGKLDHSFANIQLSSYLADRGARALFVGNEESFLVLKNASLTLKKRESGRISVFSLDEKSEGVTIKGLSYEIENAVLTRAFPLGVSNSFINKEAEISVKNGELLVIWQTEAEE